MAVSTTGREKKCSEKGSLLAMRQSRKAHVIFSLGTYQTKVRHPPSPKNSLEEKMELDSGADSPEASEDELYLEGDAYS